MILAECLCLFGFDPRNGRERDAPERDVLDTTVAGLMLADLLHVGRFVMNADHLLQHDHLPLAHPLLREAAERLSAPRTRTPQEAMRELRPFARRWWDRMHKSLAARDILEMQVPIPFLRRYRLRSRQAWQDASAPLHEPTSRSLASVALTLAAHRCGWLADLVDADSARRCLVAAQSATTRDDAVAHIARALAAS
jgi:hypothetical protein